jgi:transglutaminase/protease-like cytokinesis protein 3
MKYFILFLGILSISLVTVLNFYPDEVKDFLTDIFDKKEAVIPKENDYFLSTDFKYIDNYTDDVSNKRELLNYIYYVINTGSEYADGECTKEYTNCISDLEAIADDNEALSILNNFVHPYNSFKTITFIPNTKTKFSIAVEHVYTTSEIAEINYVVDKELNELVTDNMTSQNKVKAIHDYIIENTKYDSLKSENINDETYKSNTAYGVLIQGYGICSGYSDTMAIFLNRLGIENYKISNDKHIWNLVHINGVWTHLDATWDDPISEFNENRDTYFLISTDELDKLNDDTHSFNRTIYLEA